VYLSIDSHCDRPERKVCSAGIAVEFLGEVRIDNTASPWVINGNVQLVFISPENFICNLKYHQMLSTVYKKKQKTADWC